MKTFDVAIIGGGLIGASAAFELAGDKLGVLVVDQQEPGCEASWAAAGMLSPAPDSPRDLPLAPLGLESLRLYPDFVAAVEAESGQITGYAREGALEVFVGAEAETDGDRRVGELRRLNVEAEAIHVQAAREWEPSLTANAGAVVWLPDEGTVEPRALTNATIAAAKHRGVEFRPGCAVSDLIAERDRCTGIVAGGEKISAKTVVVAAGCFSSQIADSRNWIARLAPTQPVRGQMVALRPRGAGIRRVLRSQHGYLVARRDGRIVAGSTSEDAGFEKRVTSEGLKKILDAARGLFPALAEAEQIESWSGLRPGTPDDLPILGPTDIEGLLIATGHYRNGILLAPVTAKLIREWIVTQRTKIDATRFSPLRFQEKGLTATASADD